MNTRKHHLRLSSVLQGPFQTAFLSLIVLFGVCGHSFGQSIQNGSNISSPTISNSNISGSTTGTSIEASRIDNSDTTSSMPSSPRMALTARQILSIMQQKPEVVIELKSLVANMQPADVEIQPDSITDEMLYDQIASSSDVRIKITEFLRARGYISDADLLHMLSTQDTNREEEPVPSESLQEMSRLPGSDFALSGSPTLRRDTLSPTSDRWLNPESIFNGQAENKAYSGKSGRQHERITPEHNSTDEPQVLRQPTPYNLLSLRDLYTQVPDSSVPLKRFGSEVFVNRGTTSAARLGVMPGATPLDVPVGPDYVVDPGDRLTIDMWGGITQSFTRDIGRDGSIMLPEAGEVQVAGLTLDRAQKVIQSALQRQFRNVQVAVTVSRLHTVRVFVVGDVQRPGAYDISSLSSPLNALYVAGGPTAIGSLRVLDHYRGDKLIEKIDLYDFLLHGVHKSDDRFQGGDTLLVPPTGPQVAISGAVKRPAIYELKDEKTLGAAIEDAGGFTVAASLAHITIERIDANQHRETVSLDLTAKSDPLAAIAAFPVKDGDRIRVAPILPYSEKVVYLEGHVVRPGRLPYRDGMQLSEVLRSYQDLLPEPANRGELIRLVPPDLHPETIDFNVPDILIGNNNLPLQPFDTIRIFGRYEVDTPTVKIRGEVLRPGSYPLSEGMTAAQLVRMAGGFKRDALLTDADLMSYQVVNGTKVVTRREDLQIGDAVLKEDNNADVRLKSGDILTVHQLTGWNDIGASIMIEGEVAHPGSYGFQEGEHLSDLLKRAGGFRQTAYPAGAVLTREEVRQLEQKSRTELIRQIEASSTAARLSPNIGTGDQSSNLQLIQQQQEQVLARLRSEPPSGRLVIHISTDIASWAGTPADIEVRRGDVLHIPKRPGFVLVSGQVYNTSAITFVPDKTAGWYLAHAGGATSIANRKEIFIIRANGSVIGRRSRSWHEEKVLSTRLDPGDTVEVPQKIIGTSLFWKNLLTTAQIAASVAITAAVATGL